MIKIKAKLLEKYEIMSMGQACQFSGIEIYCYQIGTGHNLSLKVYIPTILRPFAKKYSHCVSTWIDSNVILDIAQNWWENELDNITDYQTVVWLLMYAALATMLDILYTVAALSHYS